MILNWDDYSIQIAFASSVLYDVDVDDSVRDLNYVKFDNKIRKWIAINEFNVKESDVIGLFKDGLIYLLSQVS